MDLFIFNWHSSASFLHISDDLFFSSYEMVTQNIPSACFWSDVKKNPTHLMSPKSFLFPAMATTMSSGPCSFSSFTHFFSVWKESWVREAQQAQLQERHSGKYVFLFHQSSCSHQSQEHGQQNLLWRQQTHQFSDVVDNDSSSRSSVIHRS